jgi:hypothetical protein
VLLREVARLTGNTDLVQIHLDDQIYSKVCANRLLAVL